MGICKQSCAAIATIPENACQVLCECQVRIIRGKVNLLMHLVAKLDVDSQDGYKTVTKIEYLQQEMARIQLEMSKLQEDEPENYEAEIVEDYVPMDSQMPIPTPPEIMPGDVPLYMILKNAADAKVFNLKSNHFVE